MWWHEVKSKEHELSVRTVRRSEEAMNAGRIHNQGGRYTSVLGRRAVQQQLQQKRRWLRVARHCTKGDQRFVHAKEVVASANLSLSPANPTTPLSCPVYLVSSIRSHCR